MSDGFPGQRQSPLAKEKPEEDSKDEGQLLQVVTVDVYVGEEADEAAGTNEASPVPLPAPADWIEASLLGQMQPAMFGQRRHGQH